jgi:hypothetical protein
MKTQMNLFTLSILLFSVIILNSLNAQNLKNDWAKQNLKGKVNKITETSYEIKDSFGIFINSKYRNTTISIFNKNGYLIEVDYLGEDRSNVRSKNIYSYNDSGELVERNNYNSNGSLESKSIFDYTNKTITETIFSKSGEVLSIYSRNRDDGQLQKELYFNSGKLGSTNEYKYTYGNNKKVIEKIEFRNKKPNAKVTYKYDQNQRLIEENYINFSMKKPCISEYKYNNNGYLIERKDCMTKTQIKTFDEFGNQVKSYISFGKDLIPSTSYEYIYEYFK